jgi:gliding motility-associated-like protein
LPPFSIDLECKNRQDIITWENPNSLCIEGTDGIIKCLVFYFPTSLSKDSTLIRTVPVSPNISSYSVTIDTIVGCYTILAVDSAGNTSIRGNKICLDVDIKNNCIRFISYEGTFSTNGECIDIDKNGDTCYFYQLPNVFTPNGDGKNDYFIPFHLQYVEKFIKNIDIKIFNRWGTLVFQTSEPGIEWDGKDMHSKKDCSDGVYFYVCTVYEESLKGPVNKVLSGTVTILR